MPKKINSYKDLSIEWQGENNNFRLDLRPIGGGRPNFDTKAEAKQKAREMFEDNYIAGPKSKAGIRQVPITPELS